MPETTIFLDHEVGWHWGQASRLTGTDSCSCLGRRLPMLRRAIDLIRGRPFEGLRSPDWVVLEGIQAAVEAGVVDLAHRYCYHCLEVLDAAGAEWAARQGLRVSQYDERLYRVLMSRVLPSASPRKPCWGRVCHGRARPPRCR